MIDYTQFKSVVVLYCRAGGGHEQAAHAMVSQVKAVDDKIHLIMINIFDLIGARSARFFEKSIWGQAQEKEYIWIQEKLTCWLPLFDKFFYRSVCQSLMSVLTEHSVDHIIDTQPLGCQAIVDTAKAYSGLKSKRLLVEKVLTEIPGPRPSYFTLTIHKLPSENKEFVRLRVFDPAETVDTKTLTGLTSKQILNNLPPLRAGFLKESIFKSRELAIQIFSKQEQQLLLSMKGFPKTFHDDHFRVNIEEDRTNIALLLGANSSHRALKFYTMHLLHYYLRHELERAVSLFVFCPNSEIQKNLVDFYNSLVVDQRCLLFPVLKQTDSVIAPLYFHSDLTITKSGGLTSMELAWVRKKTMLIHKNPRMDLPSWEKDNAEYLIENHNASYINPDSLLSFLEKNRKIIDKR